MENMQIRRPLCLFSLIFILLVTGCVYSGERKEEFLPEEGEKIVLTGTVSNKEYRVMYGSKIPVIYVSSTEDRDDRRIMCYMTDVGGEETLPQMGETVRVSGKASLFREAANPGEFNLKEYYQILDISYKLNQTEILEHSGSCFRFGEKLFLLRCKCSNILDKIYPQREASVLKAMLLGEKTALEEEIKELYQLNGLIHILSISGLHVSLFGMAVSGLLKRCGAGVWLRAPLAIGIMWSYGIMTGMGVSTRRAVFMFALHLTADLFGRTYDILTSLAVAAALMLARQPLFALHSGYLLSFGAVLGIGAVLPWWKQLLERLAGVKTAAGKNREKKEEKDVNSILKAAKRKGTSLVVEGFCATTAIAITTLPSLFYFYYAYPLYSLLLNLYVIPLAGLVLFLGAVSVCAGFFFPQAAYFAGMPDRAVLWLYETSCRKALLLPNGIKIAGKPEIWQIMVYYGVLFLMIFWHNLAEEQRVREGRGSQRAERKHGKFQQNQNKEAILPAIPALCQCFLLLGILWLLLLRPYGGFAVTFLDVGQGDCIVMQNENGNCYMVDGGSSSKSRVGKYQILPFLESKGIQELEAVFVTHPDEDHISGIMELMEQSAYGVRIKSLILPDASQEIRREELADLRRGAAAHSIPVYYIGRGDSLRDKRLKIFCFGPRKGIATDEVNEISTVLAIEYGEFEMLLTGDVSGTSERELLSELAGKPPLTVLKVAHHGSRYSTSQEFLELTNPVYSIISSGKDNRYGHPHEELLERLKRQKCHIYETAKDGAVTIRICRGRMRIEGFKERKTELDKNEKGDRM